MKVTLPVWDLPHRLFHWLLVISVTAAYITAKIGGALIDWHGRIGIFILGLLVFRIIWGFIGSTHSRFVTFFPTFSRLAAYLKGRWQGIGHNPLGALSVIALLTVLAVQVGTGLFANDDIAFEGPLFNLVDKSSSDKLTGWHNTAFNFLLALVALHLAAIVYYRWIKKTNLVVPMLTGKKNIPVALAEVVAGRHDQGFGILRFILSLIISSTVVWGVSGGISQLYPMQSQQQVAQAPSSF
ncbi:cytochrome b/b6 domain-containing protein [Methylobacter sp.]|uniref:cytochrome b/b6 domain-containing protein n=1 Tax=Methylobacter sp. TaxID=2051955 RepID=UPI002FDED29A